MLLVLMVLRLIELLGLHLEVALSLQLEDWRLVHWVTHVVLGLLLGYLAAPRIEVSHEVLFPCAAHLFLQLLKVSVEWDFLAGEFPDKVVAGDMLLNHIIVIVDRQKLLDHFSVVRLISIPK
jgi:hypothetical protein